MRESKLVLPVDLKKCTPITACVSWYRSWNLKKNFKQATKEWKSIQFLSSVVSRDNEIREYLDLEIEDASKINVCASWYR